MKNEPLQIVPMLGGFLKRSTLKHSARKKPLLADAQENSELYKSAITCVGMAHIELTYARSNSRAETQ